LNINEYYFNNIFIDSWSKSFCVQSFRKVIKSYHKKGKKEYITFHHQLPLKQQKVKKDKFNSNKKL